MESFGTDWFMYI
jgi:transposase